MDIFSQHFRMTEVDAVQYAHEKIRLFPAGTELSAQEIGDGNLNYVFRVEDASGRSVILKQADLRTRSGQNPLDTDHNRIEADILRLQGTLAPGLVPEVYDYDPVMCCIAMEDLRDYENLRYALLAHKTFPTLAEDLSSFLAGTLLRTSDCVLPTKEKKELVGRYSNPALCDITERLVYTDPYTNHGEENLLFPPNEEFLSRELYEDRALRLEAAKLKQQFLTKAQSLLHGDLHTGSVFINKDKAMVLDPEFAFYGPAGYDLGNLIANLLFAWVNAEVTMEEPAPREAFQSWVETAVTELVALFCGKGEKILREESTDVMAGTPGFIGWYLDDILQDAMGAAGLELCRRIIGDAKVRDITDIEEAAKRVRAERLCVLCGKRFVMERAGCRDGGAFIKIIQSVRKELS